MAGCLRCFQIFSLTTPSSRLCSLILTFLLIVLGILNPLSGQAADFHASSQEPWLSVTLRPLPDPTDKEIVAVSVTLVLDVPTSQQEKLSLTLATVRDNVKTVAGDLQQLNARDSRGSLPLAFHTEESRLFRWTPERQAEGQLTISYQAPITNLPNPLGAAPPLELRSEEGSFSGALDTFLLLPSNKTPYRVRLHWDLSALPPGAVGMSSLGIGDLQLTGADALSHLRSGYVFAGSLHRFPEKPTVNGFFSAWQGKPPFDCDALMRWAKHLYDFYLGYFKPKTLNPYAVLLRRNPINAGGGVELGNAFIGTFDNHTVVKPFKMTLAHEMAHSFLGGLDQPGDETGSWYSEGLAVYYQRLLPLRAGSITADDFLEDLNSTAGRYYTDALLDTPNSRIAELFWTETRVRVLPYDRGSLYFALLDSQIRKSSGGRRSLDNIVRAMLDARLRGSSLTEESWKETLRAELGDEGVTQWKAMMNGELVLPPSDAFGPCFRRTTKRLRRYELGFEPKVLTEPTRIIRGLIPGSAAERAGLHNGDHIVKPVPQDAVQADQKAQLTLEIEREGKHISFSYLPRGESVVAYQWERKTGASGEACALASTVR